jgi:hypothetical protein
MWTLWGWYVDSRPVTRRKFAFGPNRDIRDNESIAVHDRVHGMHHLGSSAPYAVDKPLRPILVSHERIRATWSYRTCSMLETCQASGLLP